MNQEGQKVFFLWQRFLHVEIFRKNKDFLDVELFFQETSGEDHLKVELFVKDFTIKDAVWERPRSNQGIIEPLALVFLRGKGIYLKEGKNLKRAILDWGETEACISPFSAVSGGAEAQCLPLHDREHIADLFLELISNVLQAEIFILPERGIPSIEEYDRFFSELYKDTCILYSMPRGKLPEGAYTQGQKRSRTLFSRNKSICIFKEWGGEREKKGCYSVHGHLSDSFHEMAISLSVSQTTPYIIKYAGGNFLRSPDLLCRDAADKLRDLEGVSLLPENKRELISILAGPRGCSHLSDLVIEAARSLKELERTESS